MCEQPTMHPKVMITRYVVLTDQHLGIISRNVVTLIEPLVGVIRSILYLLTNREHHSFICHNFCSFLSGSEQKFFLKMLHAAVLLQWSSSKIYFMAITSHYEEPKYASKTTLWVEKSCRGGGSA